MKYEIYIEGSKCDVLEDQFGIDLGVFDSEKMDSRLSDKSPVIKLPQTPTNRGILGNLEDVNINRTIAGITGRYINGSLELKGQVVIYDTITIKGKGYFQIQIIAGNGDWIKLLQNSLISDLTFDTHEYNKTNITNSLAGTYDYIYPLTDYGIFLAEDVTDHSIVTDVKVEDRLPAISFQAVIQKIFSTIGYTLGSTFLNGAAFAKYFITYNGSPDVITKEWAETQLYEVTGTHTRTKTVDAGVEETVTDATEFTPIPFDTETTDNGSNYNHATYIYTCAGDGSFKFIADLNCRIDFAGTRQYGSGNLLEVTVSIKTSGDTLATTTVNPTDIVNFNINLESEYFWLEEGETVTCELTFSENVKNILLNNEDYTFTVLSSSSLKNLLLLRPARGYTWTLTDILPDISQVDFLRIAFNLFNLKCETNPFTRTVYIEPDDDFHTSNILDLSDKLDTSKEINILQKNIPSWIRYRMAIDGKDTEHIAKWAEVSFSNGNGSIEEKANKYLAHTLFDYARRIGIETVQIPKMWHVKEDTTYWPEQLMNYLSRLLLFDSDAAMPSGETWQFEGDTQTTYPKFTAPDFYDTYISYYTQEHRRQNNAQTVKAYLALDSNDINNLVICQSGSDYRAKVLLNDALINGYFYLNRLYKYLDGKITQCQLVQARAASTGVAVVERVVGEGGGITAGGGSSGSAGGTIVTTTCSHLITDTQVIANITASTNWSGRTYSGSLTGLTEGDYYIGNNIIYKYNGTALYRTTVNDIL